MEDNIGKSKGQQTRIYIRALRESNITASELARMTGERIATIYSWGNDENIPRWGVALLETLLENARLKTEIEIERKKGDFSFPQVSLL